MDIKAIVKSCDCTDIFIKKGILLPKERRKILFQWDTRGKRGNNEAAIDVIYSIVGDTTEKTASLVLKANVLSDFGIIPASLIINPNKRESQLINLIMLNDKQTQILIKNIIIHHPSFTSTINSDFKSATINFDPEVWVNDTRDIEAQILRLVKTNRFLRYGLKFKSRKINECDTKFVLLFFVIKIMIAYQRVRECSVCLRCLKFVNLQ
ncbi:MAG: hypothetical protein LBC68_02285 [Prevotellaceae bacterium]|nr:hypothetical protein [Prevotellaceae bacterium]